MEYRQLPRGTERERFSVLGLGMGGIQNTPPEEIEQERDYSVISSFTPPAARGSCVYCNHCRPCPAGIDIGLVNKYYDLALAGDEIAANHYTKLAVSAGACIGCGHCDRRCPFSVKQQERMKKIAKYFEEKFEK